MSGYAPAAVVVRSTFTARSPLVRVSSSGEASSALAAPSADGATYASPTLIEATDRSPTWLSSAYPTLPAPDFTAAITPEVPLAASPDLIGQTLSAGCAQPPSPAFSR